MNIVKTTLFGLFDKLNTGENYGKRLLINGCRYPNPTNEYTGTKDSVIWVMPADPLDPDRAFLYYDQDIIIIDGKAVVKGVRSTGVAFEKEWDITVTSGYRPIQESDLITTENKSFSITSDETRKILTVSILGSDKTFTITDLGNKVEIVSVNNDRHTSCLSIEKNNE